MRLVNLCDHPVAIYGNMVAPILTLPANPEPCRVNEEVKFVMNNVMRKTFVSVDNLPKPKQGTIYVVSSVVRNYFPARTDLASPLGIIIDGDEGRPIGCKYLVVN